MRSVSRASCLSSFGKLHVEFTHSYPLPFAFLLCGFMRLIYVFHCR